MLLQQIELLKQKIKDLEHSNEMLQATAKSSQELATLVCPLILQFVIL